MANVTITQLPAAGAITGSELVPIVQNGVTVHTTTGAISASPSQTQTFLTKNQEPSLPNSRYLSTDGNLSLADGGAQSYYRISLTGAAASLNSVGNGIMVKTDSVTLTNRTIGVSTAGISVANGDGISGNPAISLTGLPLALAGFTGTGFVSIQNGTTLTPVSINGTANQIGVANGNASGGNPPIISIVDNPVIPGVAGMVLPSGQTANRSLTPTNGTIRYSTTLSRFEGYQGGSWTTFGVGDGTVTNVAGTVDQIDVVNGSTTPTISITDDPILPGLGGVVLPKGTTAQRATPQNGLIRYNTTTETFEGYANGVWGGIAVGVGVTSVGTGTGLEGGPITSTGTISISNTGVTAGSYGSNYQVPTYTVNAQGQLTAAANVSISATAIGAVTSVSGTANEITSSGGQTPVISLPNLLNFTGKTIIGGIFQNVAINTASTIDASVIGGTTPAAGTFTALTANTDVTLAPSTTGTINNVTIGATTPRAGTFTNLTANTNVALAPSTLGSINNVQIGNTTPAAATFTNSAMTTGQVTNQPTNPSDIANKAYVDNLAGAGLTIHTPVYLESPSTTGNLTATYANGGTTPTWTTIVGTSIVETGSAHGLAINDVIVFTSTTNGITSGTPYFVHSIPSSTGITLSLTYNGALINTLTAGTGLTIGSRANSGVGATLTNAGTQVALQIDGVSPTVGQRVLIYSQTNGFENGVYTVTATGSGSTNWVLTRATNEDTYAPAATNSLGQGDYFYVQAGDSGAGESYVCTTNGTIVFGTTNIAFTQFSAAQVYSAGTGLTLSGTQFSITNTAVTAGSYGAASKTLTASVNAQGQLTALADTPIAIANTQVSGLGTMSVQNANNVAISGGAINGTSVGATTASTGAFTTLDASGNATVGGTLGVTGTSTFTGLISANGGVSGAVTSSSVTITGGTINNTAIGGTTPDTGAFTTLSASSNATVGGTLGVTGASTFTGLITGNGGYTGAVTSSSVTLTGGTINGVTIGGTTAAAGTFTNLTASTSANFSPTGAVTISPGTAGSMDNMAIGGVTPRAGAFTTISATGDGTFSGTGQIKLPAGTSLQRSGTPANGMIRYNTDTVGFEGYSDGAWGALGGGGGAVADGCIYTNFQTIYGNFTFDPTTNGSSVGPITIDSGAIVTVSTGSRWIVL
jgi:hypothetical protein